MTVGTFRYASELFIVYDDGSLASERCWYEDPPTAARELGLPVETLSYMTERVLDEWKNDPSRGRSRSVI